MYSIACFISIAVLLIVTRESVASPSIFNTEDWITIDPKSPTQYPVPATDSWKFPDASIFVGIPVYRDHNRCAKTIKSIFDNAKFPSRVHIGLVQQIHTEEDAEGGCLHHYCALYGGSFPNKKGKQNCPYFDQISVTTMSYLDSRGPGFARSMMGGMRSGEEFCLGVHAHSEFVSDWDIIGMHMWGSINNEFAILSTATLSKIDGDEVPHVCQATFNENGMIRNLCPRKAARLPSPLLTSLYSSEFHLSKCHAEDRVPNDPNLLYLLDGNDFSIYARLWTRGYDVYTPNKVIVTHVSEGGDGIDLNRWAKEGMHDEYRWEMYSSSLQRVKTLLGMDDGAKDVHSIIRLGKYGLGVVRSLDQLIQFTGIDFRRKVVFADRCVALEYVPFELNSAILGVGDSWAGSPESIPAGSGIPLLPGPVTAIALSGSVLSSQRLSGSSERSKLRGDRNPLIAPHLQSGKFIVGGIDIGTDINALEDAASGELWWIFQAVDCGVENFIDYVDTNIGRGHGHRVLKLLLLIAPIFVLVVGAAVNVLLNSSKARLEAKLI